MFSELSSIGWWAVIMGFIFGLFGIVVGTRMLVDYIIHKIRRHKRGNV